MSVSCFRSALSLLFWGLSIVSPHLQVEGFVTSSHDYHHYARYHTISRHPQHADRLCPCLLQHRWTPPPRNGRDARSCRMMMVNYPSSMTMRRNVKIPLLDVPDPTPSEGGSTPKLDANQPLVVMPLPSDHLPPELRDLNIYGMELQRPVHKLIMGKSIELATLQTNKPVYGHVAWKQPDNGEWVGAIGCVAEILLQADGNQMTAMMGGGVDSLGGGSLETAAQASSEESLPKTIVCCGAFRFIVTEVLQTVPFPIVLVDELSDQEPGATPSNDMGMRNSDQGDEDHDDDDDDDDYDGMTPSQMIQELFQIVQAHVDQMVEEASNQQISPLEQSILEDSGMSPMTDPVSAEQTKAEQMAATWIAFRSAFLDIAPTPMEQYFSAAMMAAEIMNLSNPVRRKILTMVHGIDRLKLVLRHVKDAAGMAQARKMAKQITDSNDESSKDLKVGTPELPPWSRQIRKGMKLSYYWNEEWEWCEAEVIEDPVMVVDELIVTVRFEDGEVHRLPFHPDEKARWRPA